jgi:L-aminopeptidase/D-esterase-like protein
MKRASVCAVLLGLMTITADLKVRTTGTVVQAFRPASQPPSSNSTITAVPGIRVGHHTLTERPTGCTVVLVDGDAVGGVSQRGGAPGTEKPTCSILNIVDKVNAVVLSGGSAFRPMPSGVVRWLDGKASAGRPPPGGADRHRRHPVRPGSGEPEDPSHRRLRLSRGAGRYGPPGQEGSIGAGAGATIGKFGGGQPMKAGIGSAAIALPSGLVVAAIVAVNAVGDIIDPATGAVVAGVRGQDGRLADARRLLRSGQATARPQPGENTTIGVVATNARLSKAEASRMALMADDGYARAIYPSHTEGDGDTIFALATGRWDGTASVTAIGALAADAMALAVVRAATEATGVAGIPAARDLRR